ncbi:MAG: hypothetical protein J7L61_03985 [Thermoplasmata archaeon]|nr:hypothetical protein [Thermoplasmata archaeon]
MVPPMRMTVFSSESRESGGRRFHGSPGLLDTRKWVVRAVVLTLLLTLVPYVGPFQGPPAVVDAIDSASEPLEIVDSFPENVTIRDVYWSWDGDFAILVGDGVVWYYITEYDLWYNLSSKVSPDDVLRLVDLAPSWGFFAAGTPGKWGHPAYVAGGDTEGFMPFRTALGDVEDSDVSGSGSMIVSNRTDAFFYTRGSATWMPTPRMNLGRVRCALAPVGDDRVMAFGGYSGWTPLGSYEIYNVTRAMWVGSFTMSPARGNLTATVLDDGRVLFAGGDAGLGSPVSDATIFDPDTETWSSIDPMPIALSNHKAILLNNGTVFVVGGMDSAGQYVPDAFLCNATSGVWYTLPPLPSGGRIDHTVALLDDGNVLVAGGKLNNGRATDEVWIFNTTSNTWVSANSMLYARYGHVSARVADGGIMVAGGKNDSGYLDTVELYDPSTGNWSVQCTLSQARAYMTCAKLPDGKFIFAGGTSSSGVASKTAEIYSRDSGVSSINKIKLNRTFHSSVALDDGRIFVLGGENESGNALPIGEIFDYGWGKWYPIQGLPVGWNITSLDHDDGHYSHLIAVEKNGSSQIYYMAQRSPKARKLIALPGMNVSHIFMDPSGSEFLVQGSGGVLRKIALNHASVDYSWMPIPQTNVRPPPRSKYALTCTSELGIALLFGGSDGLGGLYGDTWVYYTNGDEWFNFTTPAFPSPSPRRGAAIAFCPDNDRFYMFGGYDGSMANDTWTFAIDTMRWFKLSPPTHPPAREGGRMVYDPDTGNIFLFGGKTSTSYLNDVWVLNTTTEEWTEIFPGAGPAARAYHAMTYSEDSNGILVYGGMTWGSLPLGDTWVFNTTLETWTNKTSGTEPSPRFGVSMTMLNSAGDIILQGGDNGSQVFSNTYIYNATRNVWEPLHVMEEGLARAFYTIFGNRDGSVFAFGGDSNGAAAGGSVGSFAYLAAIYNISASADGYVYGLPDSVTINNGAWNYAGDTLVMVGDGGAIYSYTHGQRMVNNLTDPSLTTDDLYGVDYKPPHSPGFFFLVGFGGTVVKLSSTLVTSQITASVYMPHVNSLDFLSGHTIGTESGDVSKLNAQVDVDVGNGATTYWVKINVTDRDGVGTLSNITLSLWYDNGHTAAASVPPTGVMNNTRVRLFYNFTTDAWSILGDSGLNEFQISSWDTVILNSTTEILYVEIVPGPQVRAASGPFTESGGTAASDQSDMSAALNDPYTWDMKALLNDTAGNQDTGYDEFGFFKFTSISQSGLPGDQSGQGPPGVPLVLSPTGNVTFISNCPYRLNVSVSNLTGQNIPTNQIDANRIGVKGGDLQGAGYMGTSFFADSKTPQVLLGGPTTYVAPNDSGNETNTSSAKNGAVAVGTVLWVCDVPMVPEDTYIGTATFTLHNQK